MSDQATLSRPVSTADPFSHAFLAIPIRIIRRCARRDPWCGSSNTHMAMARHEQVRDAPDRLADLLFVRRRRFGAISERSRMASPPSIILEADPPLQHAHPRGADAHPVAGGDQDPADTFEREAERLIAQLVEQREFDGVADLAEAYPLKVFPDAVGISEESRENLLPYGTMVFNSFGPRNDLVQQAMANAGPVRDWIMSSAAARRWRKAGLGLQIFAAVDAARLTGG